MSSKNHLAQENKFLLCTIMFQLQNYRLHRSTRIPRLNANRYVLKRKSNGLREQVYMYIKHSKTSIKLLD